MLFNPNAERFTLNQLRNMAILANATLKRDLDAALKSKSSAEEVYSLCKKTESNQRAFDGEIKQINEWVDRIDKRVYRDITHDLLAREQMYGFGTPLPISPQSSIQVVPPNYWLFLELDPEKSEAHGHGLHYVGVFFQETKDLPAETIALVKQWQSSTSIAPQPKAQPAEKKESSKSDFYIAPYLQLMLDAAQHFSANISSPRLKKDTIMIWFRKKAVEKGFTLSDRAVEVMATAIRPLEAQKGGIKPTAGTTKQGDTVKLSEDA